VYSSKEHERLLPTFETGSEVTLILDLRQETGGTLLASIDGSGSFLLFSGMLEHEGVRGFRSSVFCDASGKVRLVGMEGQQCAKSAEMYRWKV
jgi:C-terminal processing protease CtpA/Prc